MAGRAKVAVRTHVLPKDVPEGMELVDCKRTIGSGDDKVMGAVIQTLVPVAGADASVGIIACAEYLSGILEGEDTGPEYMVEAVRSAMVTSMVAQGDPANVEAVGSIVPRISRLSTVDKGAVAGARLTDFIAKEGRAPTSQEMKDIYSGLTL